MEFQLSYIKSYKWCCESAALSMSANLENWAAATGLEKVSFHSNTKERQCQRMLKTTTQLHPSHIALISHATPGVGNGNPLQYSCLENLVDRGAWWATVHGVAKSQAQLSNWTHTYTHTSKVMLKILQARLQQNMNHELPDVQAGFRKGPGTRDQIANIHWIIKKVENFRKTSASLTMSKPLTA